MLRFLASVARSGSGWRRILLALAVALLAAVAVLAVLHAGIASGTGATTPAYAARPSASRSAGGGWTVSATPSTAGRTGAWSSTSAATPEVLVVDVEGDVAHPGLVTLAGGARVADAVRAAGGVRPGGDSRGVNLAAVLHDGDQVVVGPVASGGVQAAGTAGAPTGPVDVNRASAQQLDALPGIGPALAQRIVAWRVAHGRFASVDALRQVSGIGDHVLAGLRGLVVAG